MRPERRFTGLACSSFRNVCERNAMPKSTTTSGAAITWIDSIAGSQGWLMSANGSSVVIRYFMQKYATPLSVMAACIALKNQRSTRGTRAHRSRAAITGDAPLPAAPDREPAPGARPR